MRTRCPSIVSLHLSLLLTASGARGPRYKNGIHGRRRSLQEDEGQLALLPPKPSGDVSCPCLSTEALAVDFPAELIGDAAGEFLGPNINISVYGDGCAPHDVNASQCSSADDCTTIVPLPPDCDRSYCMRSFCYVDPDDCSLLHRPSIVLRGRHFSYAACGFMDSFTYTERLGSLKGKTFQVSFNHNSGGWKGAYNPKGSFAVNGLWEGPIVNFVQSAALEGGFSVNITRPPEWLRAESRKFFGSSSFDYCVYATALGYVDMCVAAYTITDKRASVTTFFETTDDPIYLIVFEEEGKTTWESFRKSLLTIFQPFTLESWLMIVLFCLPVLGLIVFVHEYGAPGSAYARKVPVVLLDYATGNVKQYSTREVSVPKHMVRSVYMSFLAFFQESYDQSVVTLGGKIHLLGISSFVLLVLAVYTANLAAILTTDITETRVGSIEEAVQAGYNFCSERKVAQIVMDLHDIDSGLIVPDPVSIGGDGRPGFNCPNCKARQRVFEYMKNEHEDSSLYCNAAFASWEDLQVLHNSGDHCDKTRVGEILAFQNIGIPLYEGVSGALLSLFHRMKNDGQIERELSAGEPASQCPVTEGEGHALSIEQLTGIWVISFSFAIAALLAKFIQRCAKKRSLEGSSGIRTRPVQRYDQWGNPTDHDIFINGRLFDKDEMRELHKTASNKNLMQRMLVHSHSIMHRHPRRQEIDEVSSSIDENFKKRDSDEESSSIDEKIKKGGDDEESSSIDEEADPFDEGADSIFDAETQQL